MQLAINGSGGQYYETDDIFYIWERGVGALFALNRSHGFHSGYKKKKATLVLMSYS